MTALEERIARVRERFEAAWQTGTPPRLDDYLVGWQGDDLVALMRELVLVEVQYHPSGGTQRSRVQPPPASAHLAETIIPEPLAPEPASAPLLADPGMTRPTGRAANSSNRLLPPGYEYLGELGRGGMGVVYLARSIALQRPCALKMILSGVHSEFSEIQRFHIEAQALARVQHPGIVQVFEIGEHGDTASGTTLPFMALEYCGGGSLDAVLAQNPLESRAAAELVRKLAEAIQAAHTVNVIHRDLKPSNVLLAGERRDVSPPVQQEPADLRRAARLEPKIADFGLAKKLDENGATRTGSILGTPSYMSPEQARGSNDIGPATDVYALGAILYECLAGRPPFRAATAVETMSQVLDTEPVPLRQLSPQTPIDLETIAHKCLQKDAARRYPSAQALADDLGRYLEGRPITARPIGPIERTVKWLRRNALVSALTGLVVLALLAGVIVSSQFAIEADRRATREAEARKLAQDEKQRADDAATIARNAEKGEYAARMLAEERLGRAESLVYAGKLALAQSDLDEGKGSLALLHLRECQWNLRGWEHHHLWTRSSSKQTLSGHPSMVTGVAWSPDGQRLLTACADKTARVWDAQTGQNQWILRGHTNIVSCVAMSPDGKQIVTGGYDRLVRLWDAQTGKEMRSLKGHMDSVTSAVWSPDGKQILTGSQDRSVKIWDAANGQETRTLRGIPTGVLCLAVHPDGSRVLAGGEGGVVKIWETATGRDVLMLPAHTDRVTGVTWSPDGRRFATASNDQIVRVWAVNPPRTIFTLSRHTRGVTSLTYSPDGGLLASTSEDNTTRIWDALAGRELLTLKGNLDAVNSAAFSPDGRRLVTGSYDGTARVWDALLGQDGPVLRGHTQLLTGVSFSADGRLALTSSTDTTARLWDVVTGQEQRSHPCNKERLAASALSPDGTCFATAGVDKTVRVWNAETGQEMAVCQGHAGRVARVVWSPDGKRLGTVSEDKTAKLWEASTGKELRTFTGHTATVEAIAFRPDGAQMVTGGNDHTTRIWDAESGQEIRVLRGHRNTVHAVAWSRDGRWIVTGGGDRVARVWNAETGTELHTLEGHTDRVVSVGFNRDATRVLTGSWDNLARLWDRESGFEVLTLRGHTNRIASAAFSPDGQRILTGSYDNTARLWIAEQQQENLSLPLAGDAGKLLAWSADGKRLFAWDAQDRVRAWDMVKGQAIDTVDAPSVRGEAGPVRSPDGSREARLAENRVVVRNLQRETRPNYWPLPEAAERLRYHTDQAARAERVQRWFAVAFHLGRLLVDDPDNEDLKKRRDAALQKHAARPVP